jgi:glycogen synthase
MAQSIERSTRKPEVVSPPTEEPTNGVYTTKETAEAPEAKPAAPLPPPPPDQETLRRVSWEIGVRRPCDGYAPPHNHVALGMVNPFQGFAHWRILQKWIDDTAWSRGTAWYNCRLILRLYDVSFINFSGFNAHRIQDVDLPAIAGNVFFNLPRPGTFQLGEVGFLLRGGEFIPASRSHVTQFANDAVSPRHDHSALLVDDKLHIEEVGNLWEQDRVLQERRKPKIRTGLRLASFAFEAPVCGQQSPVARFAVELASQEAALGYEVHLFVPACPQLSEPAVLNGVHYHPLEIRPDGSAVEKALSFARSAEEKLREMPSFDLYHMHEWMTGLAPWAGSRPTVVSLTSIESSRLNGAVPGEQSLEIMNLERELAHSVECILTPDWLRSRAIHEFGIDGSIVHAFPMEARLPDEWECPLDFGDAKRSIGFGPLDQMLLFIGPLEHAAGVDILLEALPTLLNRCPKVRVAFAGSGSMHGHLEWLAHHMGVGGCVRVLGHVHRDMIVRLMRSAEALVLPSRYRVAQDDAVVDLARRAGRPVVTTNNGPCYLIRHEENGIVGFDNPNSMVWALERILRDPTHAWHMGQAGKRSENASVSWGEVTRRYLEVCAQSFPELAEPRS